MFRLAPKQCGYATSHLQTDMQRADVCDLERGFLAHHLALVPRLATNCVA